MKYIFIMFMLAGCTFSKKLILPKFQVGDCICLFDEESWEHSATITRQILEVGKTHYRFRYLNGDDSSLDSKLSLLFTKDDYFQKIPCN